MYDKSITVTGRVVVCVIVIWTLLLALGTWIHFRAESVPATPKASSVPVYGPWTAGMLCIPEKGMA